MTGAKYNDTYKKVSTMGEKLKAAGKQGPSNDEQLHVRLPIHTPTSNPSRTYVSQPYQRTLKNDLGEEVKGCLQRKANRLNSSTRTPR
jgi:hypothetical protein